MATSSVSFTSATTGTPIFIRHNDQYSAVITGTWVGTVRLETSTDGGSSWTLVSSHTANLSSITHRNEDKGGASMLVRFNCTAYTSGTAVTAVADVDTLFGTVTDPSGTTLLGYGEGYLKIMGNIFNRGRSYFQVPTPETATGTASLTDAQMLSGILVSTPTAAAAYTVRTGTQLKAALPADLAANDAFDLVIINLGGTTDDITLTAATDITIVGDPVVGPIADVATEQMSSGTFRFRFVSGTTFVAYRIA